MARGWRDALSDCPPRHRFFDCDGNFHRNDGIVLDPAADGSLTQVKAERIVWPDGGRHPFEAIATMIAATGEGLSYRASTIWHGYDFQIKHLHTYIYGIWHRDS